MKCTYCNEVKLASEFYRLPKRCNRGLCKECQRKMTRDWQAQHPEKTATYRKRYYQANREGLIAKEQARRNRRKQDEAPKDE